MPRAKPILIGLACIAASLTGLVFCVGSPRYYSAKYAPVPTLGSPGIFPSALERTPQTEPHTCGFCALSSVYRAHGLSPQDADLRFRLGVDKPLSFLSPSTTGTIPHDMLRVLEQDGFRAEFLLADDGRALPRLRGHLGRGYAALALIKVNELHWVALRGLDGPDTFITDSLEEATAATPLDAFFQERVKAVLLIRATAAPPAYGER